MYNKKTYREYIEEAKNKIRELLSKEKAMHVTELRVRLDGSVDEKFVFGIGLPMMLYRKCIVRGR